MTTWLMIPKNILHVHINFNIYPKNENIVIGRLLIPHDKFKAFENS